MSFEGGTLLLSGAHNQMFGKCAFLNLDLNTGVYSFILFREHAKFLKVISHIPCSVLELMLPM